MRFTIVDKIVVSGRGVAEIKDATGQIGSVLRERHRLCEGVADNFTVRDMTEMTNALRGTSATAGRFS